MDTLTSARPEYFAAAVEAMQDAYGSVRSYLQDGLDLDETRLRILRDAFLETV